MQLFVVLLKVVFVAVFIGTASGEGKGGEHSSKSQPGGENGSNPQAGGAVRVCPAELGGDETPMALKANHILSDCFGRLKTNTSQFVLDTGTYEEISAYFNEFCQKLSPVRECFRDKSTNSEVCPNKTMFKSLNIGLSLVEHLLDYGCFENGRRAAELVHGFNLLKEHNKPIHEQVWKTCRSRAVLMFNTVQESDADVSSKYFILHKEIVTLKECVDNVLLDLPLRAVVGDLLDEIIATVKCIHPSGEIVTCASIDIALIRAPSICMAKTQNTDLGIYDVMENDLGICFDTIMTHDLHVPDITTDNEALRADFNDYSCTMVWHCLKDRKRVAEVCLNETENSRFARVGDSLQKALDAACSEDGKRITDIMLEVCRLKRTGQGHAVWDCAGVAKSTRKQSELDGTTPALDVRFYREVETFKGCLVGKLRGDQAIVDAVTSLINDMLGTLECVHPEEGTAVLCETLVGKA